MGETPNAFDMVATIPMSGASPGFQRGYWVHCDKVGKEPPEVQVALGGVVQATSMASDVF